MSEETVDATPTAGALAVQNIPSPEEARARWEAYVAMRDAVADDSDYQKFYDSKTKTNKRFAKKSLVKKIQTHLRVNVRVVSVDREDLGEGHFGYRCVAEAMEPNGRMVQAVGGCSTQEERFDLQRYNDEADEKYAYRQHKALARSYHDVMATAETRATNRAVMNLVGGGEVTAEEVSRDSRQEPPVDEQQYEAPPPPRQKVDVPSVKGLKDMFIATGRDEAQWETFVVVTANGKKGEVLTGPQKIALLQAIQKLTPVKDNLETQARQAGLDLDGAKG